MNRRTFLRTTAAATAMTSLRASAADQRAPRIVLRSSWQTVNIGDIGHTPGVLALIEKYIPEAEVTLWPMDVRNGVEEMLLRRFPKLRITTDKAGAYECDFLLHGSGPYLTAHRDAAAWKKETGKPYGVYGITMAAAGDPALKIMRNSGLDDACRELLVDPLPADVKAKVVWRDKFWLTDEAISTYVRSAGMLSSEMHSPIMCIGNGIPALVCRFAEQSSKGFMWRDSGLGDWLFDLDRDEDLRRIVPTALALAKDPAAAKAKAAKACEFVQRRQRENMAIVRKAMMLIALLWSCFGVWWPIRAAEPQNPSPMVEHTRDHPRLAEEPAEGRRFPLEAGTLFIPAALAGKEAMPLLVFLHGGTWIPEIAAARHSMAAFVVQRGDGYRALFEKEEAFPALVKALTEKSGMRWSGITVGGWSAGCQGIRAMLRSASAVKRIDRVLMIDGIHTSYTSGKPGPLESKIDTEVLQPIAEFAREAIAGRKWLLITHSEIFPGTFASTTETADWLLRELGVKRRAILAWGPMKTQQLSEAASGSFRLAGFAGNAAPDHVDQLHALSDWLALIERGP